MKGLAELVVSLCDLCEAEGRLLESGILRTVRRAALLSLGLLFGAAALALLLAALYALLTSLLPTPAALALLGGASAAVAGILLWSVRVRVAPPAVGLKPGEAPEAAKPALSAVAPTSEARSSEAPEERAPEQGPVQTHDPWARVAPYGHGGETSVRTAPGKSLGPARAGGSKGAHLSGRDER